MSGKDRPLPVQLQNFAMSPIVNDDEMVSFALNAPQAQSVQVAGGGIPDSPAAMNLGKDGIWHVTLGPFAPGVYFYVFIVDGLPMIDPSNRMMHRNMHPSASMVIVPGTPSCFYEERDVPRGTVHIHRHRSSTLGNDRGYSVYTPPGYRDDTHAPYPVLYLLHGYTETEEVLYTSGRVNVIMDNLFSEGEAVPMFVVMPLGYPHPEDSDGIGSWEDWFLRAMPPFEQYIVNELIPLIDQEYRTQSTPTGRAVAGVSMGGGQAIRLGLGNAEVFGWIGAISSVIVDRLHSPLLAEPDRLNQALSLFWIGCGQDDRFCEYNVEFIEDLKDHGVKHTSHISEGGHSWSAWHHYIREFATLLFKEEM